jgi:uncharacterized coiled-coil protein SlyX
MKTAIALLLLAVVAPRSVCGDEEGNPIQKVLGMISDLQAKIIHEGEEAQKVYEEYAEFCEDRSKELGFEVKTGKATVEDLSAVIAEAAADVASLTTKVEELAEKIGKDEKELKEATGVRNKEKATFDAEEKELLSVVDTLGRAIGILEKEMAKSGASMLQLKSAQNVEQALSVMVDAAMISIADGSKLTALVQSAQGSEDSEMGAPAAAATENQSGGIVEVMQGLYDKAEDSLAALRQKETANLQAFKMMAASLGDAIKYAKKEMAEAKKDIAENEEKKSEAEGDLQVTSKDLASDMAAMAELHQDCMTKASDFEDETNSRAEELKALATAKKIIVEATSLAQEQQAADSFLQLRRSKNAMQAQSRNYQAIEMVRNLAKSQKSTALSQLASHLSSVVSYGTRSGEDVFAKVKGLIADMIGKLEAEAEADASKKAYCDKENAESAEKKDAKETDQEKLTTAIDTMTANIEKLGEEVTVLQKELGDISKAQAEMDKVRSEEKALFDKSSAELKKGINGIKLALKVLTEYYAKGDSGAGNSIISMLEVAESDFTKSLAEMTSTEETAVAEYEKETESNTLATTTKNQDVKYKTKESKQTKVTLAESKEDLASVNEELGAVLEYIEKLKGKCFPLPPESYEDRVKRREAEIAGLKNALSILEETAFLQTNSKRSLRRVTVQRA